MGLTAAAARATAARIQAAREETGLATDAARAAWKPIKAVLVGVGVRVGVGVDDVDVWHLLRRRVLRHDIRLYDGGTCNGELYGGLYGLYGGLYELYGGLYGGTQRNSIGLGQLEELHFVARLHVDTVCDLLELFLGVLFEHR